MPRLSRARGEQPTEQASHQPRSAASPRWPAALSNAGAACLYVPVAVSRERQEALLAQRNLEALMPSAMADDMVVLLWRSMAELIHSGDHGVGYAHHGRLAQGWVMAVAEAAGFDKRLMAESFGLVVGELGTVLMTEVSWRVARTPDDDTMQTQQELAVDILRSIKRKA